MANVQTFIYVNQSVTNAQDWLKTHNSDTSIAWNNNANDYYRSLVFTSDGHLLTHGLDFSSAASYDIGLIYNSQQGVVSSAKPSNDGNAYFPTFTTNTGNTSVSVGWIKASDILTSSYTGSTSITTVGTITTGTWHGSIIDVAHGGTGTNTLAQGQVLIGNGNNPVTTLAIDTVVSGNSDNLITSGAVDTAIKAGFAANDAMVFKGTIGTGGNPASLPTNGYSAGWTYRVIEAGTYAGQKCEVGDLIIAIKDGPSTGSSVINADWTVAQTNIDGALTEANLAGTDNGLKRFVNKDSTSSKLYITQLMRQINVKGVSKIGSDSNTALNFVDGTGISVSYDNGVKMSLSNSVTAITTASLLKIKHDAQGLITESTAWTPATLTIKDVLSSYNASASTKADKIYNPDNGALSFAAGRGLSIYLESNIPTIGHENKTVATNVTASARTYINSIKIDSYGHVTELGTGTETVTNTWRPINAYRFSGTSTSGSISAAEIRDTSTGTSRLCFGSDFVAVDLDTNTNMPGSEIHLVWAEVAADGTVSYHV